MNTDEAPEDRRRSDRGKDRLSQKISRLGEWVLAAAFFAAPLTSLRVGGSVTASDVMLTVAALLAGVLLLLRPRLPFSSRWMWGGAGVLVLSMLVVQAFPPASVEALAESFNGADYSSSLSAGARLIIALIVLPAAVSIVVSRWSAIPLLANAFVLGACVSCGATLLDAYAGTSIQTSLADNPEQVAGALALQPPRYVGLTGHPNILALTAVMALPLVVCRMTSVRRLLLGLPIGVLFLVAILLSGSRGGLVGFALVTILSLALNPRLRSVALSLDRRVLGSYAAGAAVTVLLVFVVPIESTSQSAVEPVPVETVPESDEAVKGDKKASPEEPGASPEQPEAPPERPDDEVAALSRVDPTGFSARYSDEIRRGYLEDSVEYVRDRPLVGYGFEWIESSHNIYLQLLVSGGLLALVGYLMVMTGYLKEILMMRSRLSGPRLDLLTAFAVSIVAYLVLGVVLPDIVDRYLYLAAALVLSMSALLRSSPEAEPSNDDS